MNGNWGFHATDHYFKPASMLIKKLVECVSKGGNMILNIGPDAKGNIPKRVCEGSEGDWRLDVPKWKEHLRMYQSRAG